MFDELAEILEDFPGKPNQTRCFAHILNLIAKTIIKQFDTPKKSSEDLPDDERMLAELAEGIEFEEAETRRAQDDTEEEDNIDGWVDEEELLSEEEQSELRAATLPIRCVLLKVRQGVIDLKAQQ
jgi:hypothetical protein